MVFLWIILALSVCGIAAYFLFQKESKPENPLANIKFKDISLGELEDHGRSCSKVKSDISIGKSGGKLISILKECYRNITKNNAFFNRNSKKNSNLNAAIRYFIENDDVLEDEYKTILYNLKRSYNGKLPITPHGTVRIYEAGKEFVSSVDGIIDEKKLKAFFKGFNENEPVTMAELRAFPIILKIALMERLNGISSSLIYIEKERAKGLKIAEELAMGITYEKIESIEEKICRMDMKFTEPMAEMMLRIAESNGIKAERLKEKVAHSLGMSADELHILSGRVQKIEKICEIYEENAAESLEFIDRYNWKSFFEDMSVTEGILRQDPAGVYISMDDGAKAYYRYAVEKLACRWKMREADVARAALRLSSCNVKGCRGHVGYYLIDEGRTELAHNLNKHILKPVMNNLFFVKYIGWILLISALFEIVMIKIISACLYDNPLWIRVMIGMLALMPFISLGKFITEWGVYKFKSPSFMPEIDFYKKIFKEYEVNKYDSCERKKIVFRKLSHVSERKISGLEISEDKAKAYSIFASRFLCGRGDMEKKIKEGKEYQYLFSYGISGKLPIIFLIADVMDSLNAVREMVECHRYLKTVGIQYDLVIYCPENEGYKVMAEGIISYYIYKSCGAFKGGGKIYYFRGESLPYHAKDAFAKTAAAVIKAEKVDEVFKNNKNFQP